MSACTAARIPARSSARFMFGSPALVGGPNQRRQHGGRRLLTYCLGILLRAGLVLASDGRSNAGVDQITKAAQLNMVPHADDRAICIQSAGNLATSQAVVTELEEAAGRGDPGADLRLC